MKETGYKDVDGRHIFTDDTLYSPELGEFKIKYRDDLGGLLMCRPAKGGEDGSFEYEKVRDMRYLEGNQFSVVGSGADKQDDINRKIIAIITRKSN
jgi:hypothetical protein